MKVLDYRRTRLFQGLFNLYVIEITGVGFLLGLYFFNQAKPLEHWFWFNVAIIAVAIIVGFLVSFSHLKHAKQVFSFACDGVMVRCDCPTRNPIKYEVPLEQIKCISRHILKQQNREAFYIVTKDDKQYEIPIGFGFNPRTAIKTVCGFNKNIEVIVIKR